jgi:hypothetical protein
MTSGWGGGGAMLAEAMLAEAMLAEQAGWMVI